MSWLRPVSSNNRAATWACRSSSGSPASVGCISGTDPALIDIADRGGQEAGAGINDYINEHRLKLQLDWIARMLHDFDTRQAAHVVHAQLDVTF